MSYSLVRVLISFMAGLVFTFLMTALIFTLSGCKTPEAALAGCDSVIKTQVDASVSQGYKLVDTQTSPAGQLAAFVNAEQAKARVYYVTPVAGAVDYLTKHGWTKAAECSANGEAVYILQRDVEIPLQPGKQA